MKLNIDLGQSMGETYPTSISPKDNEPDKYYPSFTYSGETEMKLPEEGEMVVKFRKVRSEESKTSGDETRYSCTLEIREIVSVDAEDEEDEEVETPASNKGKATEDALDNLVKARMADKSKSKY